MTPEITIRGFLEHAKRGGVVEDKVADYNTGSDYESLSGPNAIIWSHQSQRDTDLWRATRFNDATGDDLTKLVERRYGILRVKDTRGQGYATFKRATAGGGAGTIWKGTRIRALVGVRTQPTFYRVTEDVSVPAAELQIQVPIEAVKYGPGSREDSFDDLSLEDGLWDASWTVAYLRCSEGTRLEPATDYRARVRRERLSGRVGHLAKIQQVCYDAGARVISCFQSNYAGSAYDYGLNFVYVGDLGYTATPALIRACTLALRSVRVAGDNLQVLPLTRGSVTIDADIYLRDSPQVLPVERLEAIHRQAILRYFGNDDGRYEYTLGGIESAIAVTGIDVQDVKLVLPRTGASILTNGNFPSSLPRYFATDHNIHLRYHAPE